MTKTYADRTVKAIINSVINRYKEHPEAKKISQKKKEDLYERAVRAVETVAINAVFPDEEEDNIELPE